MKKILLIALMGVAMVACKKNDDTTPDNNTGGGNANTVVVAKKNTSLMTDITATWCPPCGTWGGPTFKEIAETAGDKAYSFASHAKNSDLACPASLEIQDYLKPPGVPNFFVNAVNVTYNANKQIILAEVKKNAQAAIDAFAAAEVVANSNVKMAMNAEGTSMTLSAVTQFFTTPDAGADYQLAFYVLEDKVTNGQQTQDRGYVAKYVHDHVMRTAPSGAWGEPISTEALTIGKQFKTEKTVTIDSKWKKDDISVIAVIWNNANGKHEFVNATLATK